MAVAADSNRISLSPRMKIIPDNELLVVQMNCVYSIMYFYYITQFDKNQ